jgi:hypothetical protein
LGLAFTCCDVLNTAKFLLTAPCTMFDAKRPKPVSDPSHQVHV